MMKRWLCLEALFLLGSAFGFSSSVMRGGEYEQAGSPRSVSSVSARGEKASQNGCTSSPSTDFPPLQSGATPPKAVFSPDPDYPDRARKAKHVGTVILRVGVTSHGAVQEACVLRSASPDLDESAIKAAKKWRFDPALKDGAPVPVSISVEMSFHLY